MAAAVVEEEIKTRKHLPFQAAFSRAIPDQFYEIMPTRAPRRDWSLIHF